MSLISVRSEVQIFPGPLGEAKPRCQLRRRGFFVPTAGCAPLVRRFQPPSERTGAWTVEVRDARSR